MPGLFGCRGQQRSQRSPQKNQMTKYKLEQLLSVTTQEWDRLIDVYLEDAQWLSSTTAMARLSSFDTLKAIGTPVGLHILDRMQQGEISVAFLVLLREIFQESPVKPEHAGNPLAMTKDWLEWYATT